MDRLLSTIKLDFKVQSRNNLVTISVALALLLAAGGRFALPAGSLPLALPGFFMLGVGATTYMFLGGIMIFEKNERTLDGVIVTPLTIREYLASKAITLTAIALLEASVMTFLGYGFAFNPFYLYGGLILLALLYIFIGVIVVVRYDSVTDFLVPTFLIGIGGQLPLMLVADLGPFFNALWYVIPTAAPYMLLLAAFGEIETWQLIYGIVYSAVWLVPLGLWARYAFDKHIIQLGGS